MDREFFTLKILDLFPETVSSIETKRVFEEFLIEPGSDDIENLNWDDIQESVSIQVAPQFLIFAARTKEEAENNIVLNIDSIVKNKEEATHIYWKSFPFTYQVDGSRWISFCELLIMNQTQGEITCLLGKVLPTLNGVIPNMGAALLKDNIAGLKDIGRHLKQVRDEAALKALEKDMWEKRAAAEMEKYLNGKLDKGSN